MQEYDLAEHNPVSKHAQQRGDRPSNELRCCCRAAEPWVHIRQASTKAWPRPVFIPTGLPGFPSARSTPRS